jgi:hypothetical protein
VNRYLELEQEIMDLKKRMQVISNAIGSKEAEQERIKKAVLDDFLNNGVVPAKPFEVRRLPPKPIIIDESKLPDKFVKIERKIDKKLINDCFKDGEMIDGVALDNGGYTVAVR